MSVAFTGKPLINAGGPSDQRQSQPLMMLYGQAVDTQQAMSQGKGSGTDKPLVPKEWQLVKKLPDGTEEILAENVLSFDAAASGQVVYTDGRKIMSLDKDGRSQTITTGDVVEKVILLG